MEIEDLDNPVELFHVVRSHDACLVCTVHLASSTSAPRRAFTFCVSGARIVCFGNLWHGDDGFGPHVFRRLHGELPQGVAAVDAGTAGLDALPHFEGCAKAVVVDAVRTGGQIGTVHRLVPAISSPPGGEFSLHDLGSAASWLPSQSCRRTCPTSC